MKNSNLAAAKVVKNDEFYIELSEIQAERISEKQVLPGVVSWCRPVRLAGRCIGRK